MVRRIIIILATFMTLYGCEVEYLTKVTYIYYNESGVDMKIEVYKFNDTLLEEIDVDNGDNFQQSDSDSGGPPSPFWKTARLKVVFNNEKYLEYTLSSESEPNLFNRYNYELVSKKDRKYVYKFTFTPEMYEAALPLESVDE